jgi:hypothetical protein
MGFPLIRNWLLLALDIAILRAHSDGGVGAKKIALTQICTVEGLKVPTILAQMPVHFQFEVRFHLLKYQS